MAKRKRLGVLSCGALVEWDKIWLPSREINALFYMDLKNNNQIKYLTTFPEENKNRVVHIHKVSSFENELFFFSQNSFEVWIMDRSTCLLKKYIYCVDNIKRISNIEIVNGIAWIFSDTFKIPIVCLNLKDKSIDRIHWINKEFPESDKNTFTRIVKNREKLYLSTRKANSINLCCIDCGQKKIKWDIIQNIRYVNCFTVQEDKVWIFGKNNLGKTILARYELKSMRNEEMIDVSQTVQLEETEKINYFKLILFQNKIFLIPALVKNVIVFDLLKGTGAILKYPSNIYITEIEDDPLFFYEVEQKGNKLYIYPYSSEQVLILDMEKLTFDVMFTFYDDSELKKAYEKAICQNSMTIYESKRFYMEKYFKIINAEHFSEITDEMDNIGSVVYKELLNFY